MIVAPPRSWCSDAPSMYDIAVSTKNIAAAAYTTHVQPSARCAVMPSEK